MFNIVSDSFLLIFLSFHYHLLNETQDISFSSYIFIVVKSQCTNIYLFFLVSLLRRKNYNYCLFFGASLHFQQCCSLLQLNQSYDIQEEESFFILLVYTTFFDTNIFSKKFYKMGEGRSFTINIGKLQLQLKEK